MPLSESQEDYIEAIAELIAIEGHAHTKRIAERLGVKMPSVTEALRALASQGLIVYSRNHPVELTPAGAEAAAEVMRRHTVLFRFFSEVLGLPPDKASATACRVEHQVDEDTIARFVRFTDGYLGG